MLDIFVIILIALGIFIGYKKGFVSVTLKLVGFILAFVLAITFKDSLAEFANKELGLGATISTSVKKSINDYVNAENTSNEVKSSEVQNVNNSKDETTNSFLTNNKLFASMNDEVKAAADNEKATVVNSWTNKITNFVLKGISFIAIFIIVRIIIWIVGLILNTVMDLPVLKTFNGVAGAGVQVLIIVLEIYILLSILSFLSPLEMLSKVETYINKSVIVKWMYNNNLLVTVITNKVLKK